MNNLTAVVNEILFGMNLIQKHNCFQNYQIFFLAILGSLHVLYQVWFKIICLVPRGE